MKQSSKDSDSCRFSLLKHIPLLVVIVVFFFSLALTIYTVSNIYLSYSSCSYNHHTAIHTDISTHGPEPQPIPPHVLEPTGLGHIVFGIGAAAKHWHHRKDYVKYWWQPNVTRGYVYLDKPVNVTLPDHPSDYPVLKVSSNTRRFPYSNKKGSRSALRITRIVSDMVRMGLEDVRWFVMGDDDTVFFTDNLVRVLSKYDHTKMYYIGSNSETHWQNVNFAYDMAFGGGGFAISYPLAVALEKIQDRCIKRYPALYGSDDRVHACLAELGVPLTKEPGFHQCDIYGNLFGILAAHPIAPLVTLHHLDIVDPIFPYMSRAKALERLEGPKKLDSAALMQQSICYDTTRNWTISVSWGYAVQIIRGYITPREMERPPRTFFNWYKKDDPNGLSFNSRPLSKHPCQKPYIYYLSDAVLDPETNVTGTDYVQNRIPHSKCSWKTGNPENIQQVQVYKKPNPQKWDEAPRRDCCRVLQTDKENTVVINVGDCGKGEVMEPL